MPDNEQGECPYCHKPIPSDWQMYQQGTRHKLTLTAQEVKHGITDGYPLVFHAKRLYRFLECLEEPSPRRFWQCPGSAKAAPETMLPDELYPRTPRCP